MYNIRFWNNVSLYHFGAGGIKYATVIRLKPTQEYSLIFGLLLNYFCIRKCADLIEALLSVIDNTLIIPARRDHYTAML